MKEAFYQHHIAFTVNLVPRISFALPLTDEENHENKAGFSVKKRNPLVRRCTDISACNSIKNILERAY